MQMNGSAMHIRPPAVAGLFYPDEPYELRVIVQRYLDAAPQGNGRPKALIVPHAGYSYSGPIAAAAYRRLVGLVPAVRRVVLATAGQAQRSAGEGLAGKAERPEGLGRRTDVADAAFAERRREGI